MLPLRNNRRLVVLSGKSIMGFCSLDKHGNTKLFANLYLSSDALALQNGGEFRGGAPPPLFATHGQQIRTRRFLHALISCFHNVLAIPRCCNLQHSLPFQERKYAQPFKNRKHCNLQFSWLSKAPNVVVADNIRSISRPTNIVIYRGGPADHRTRGSEPHLSEPHLNEPH